MIGIVVVSHSNSLAEGVVELAREMGGPDLSIIAAGGTGDDTSPIGTNAMRIMEAIQQADTPDGVLVLVDLGSAIMNTELAIDMLPDEMQERVKITSAPLIEGAIVASTQAKAGASLTEIMREAQSALLPKRSQLGEDSEQPPPEAPPPKDTSEWQAITLTVPNKLGLHARPAAKIVQAVAQHDAQARLTNTTTGKGPVPANSMNRVATLGAQQGHVLHIEAHGPATEALFTDLRALAEANFGDDDSQPQDVPTAPAPADAAYQAGIAASGGIAIGPARHFSVSVPTVQRKRIKDVKAERATFDDALDKARADLDELTTSITRRSSEAAGQIFEAHRLFLEDEALLDPAYEAIDSKVSAAYAWQQAYEGVAATYEELDSAYQQARAQDVRDVGRRVLSYILGIPISGPTINETGILIADDLTPADTAQLDPEVVQGIATVRGAATSHSAVLARSLGIPAVVGLGPFEVSDGTPLIVDGNEGRLYIDPTDEERTDYEKKREAQQQARQKAEATSQKPATTTDGTTIEVFANIGSVEDAQAALKAGAEGVGLFRTEFLFLDRTDAPTEEEQVEAYRQAAQAFDGRPVIIRTMDVGGDKPLPYITIPQEENPFLGQRAIRLSLAQPEMFKTQLRAIVRAAAAHPIKIMFPMIATLGELSQARALLAEATAEVKAAGHAVPEELKVGTMVEIPALALLADHFAPHVDFFSVGTNDLTQYTMAAERGNPHVANLADACHPAVLRLIRRVVEAAEGEGKWVGVCGELAGDPLAASLLVGLGVQELSMSATAIPEVKHTIRQISLSSFRTLSTQALTLTSPAEVRALARGALEG